MLLIVRWLLWLSSMNVMITIAQEITTSPTSPDQIKTFRTSKFSEWNDWRLKFPMCSPTKNPNQSPINIDKSKVVDDQASQTLFIYSGIPISSYAVSLNFTGEAGYQMDALNIMTVNTAFQRTPVFHEATYVTGLGDVSNRFLEYILFFFTDKAQVQAPLSTHQINGKGFPMEIVIFFSNRRTNDDTTQLHILVNISNVENPLFVPIVNATKIISERIKNRDKNTKLVEEKRKERQEIIERLNSQRKKLEDEGTTELLEQIEEAKQSIDDLQAEIEEKKRDIADTAALLKDEELNIKMYTEELDERKRFWRKKCNDAMKKFENSISKIIEEEEVPSYVLEEADVWENEADACQSEKIADLETIIQNKKHYEAEAQLSKQSIAELQDEIKEKEKEIKQILNELGFKTVEQLHVKYEEITSRANPDTEGNDYETRIKKLIAEMKYLDNELNFEQKLPEFQVSWLFPQVGGHFLYEGSLPVPPCTQRGYTVVFENQITISKEQFNILSSIPQTKESEPLNQCLPIISDVNKRVVRYSKKNPQYILDDGVHMKSKLRKVLKDIKNNGPQTLHYSFFYNFEIYWTTIYLFNINY